MATPDVLRNTVDSIQGGDGGAGYSSSYSGGGGAGSGGDVLLRAGEWIIPLGFVGAVLGPGSRTPVRVSRDMLKTMKPGAVLVDVDLTGLLVGATLATKPEDIYRALIEATAYGTRVIIEAFEQSRA